MEVPLYQYLRTGMYYDIDAQSGRETFPFRMSPANFRPPHIALEKQLSEWGNYLEFVRSALAQRHPKTHLHVKRN